MKTYCIIAEGMKYKNTKILKDNIKEHELDKWITIYKELYRDHIFTIMEIKDVIRS